MPPTEPDTPTAPAPPPAADPPLPVARPLPPRDFEHVYDGDDSDEFGFAPPPRRRRMAVYVRVLLAGMAVGFAVILGVAVWLNPYVTNDDGTVTARTMETHRQLGMDQCGMVKYFGKPCPACGMTTSFALLMHADPVSSARANWVGTLMCAALVFFVPWCAWSALNGKLPWVRNGELFATVVLCSLLVLMFGRWAWVLFVS